MKCKKFACNCKIEIEADKDAADYNVDTKFHVANFDPTKVAYGLNFSDPGKFAIRSIFNKNTFKESLLGQTFLPLLIFLIFYLILQILYQTNGICKLWQVVDKAARNQTICHQLFEEKVKLYDTHDDSASRYLTLILGFYVSHLVKRWYYQVSKLPSMCSVLNYICGVIYPTSNNSTGALDLSKKIARYCLLSWTMCLSSISSPLNRQFKTSQEYIDKKLITQDEFDKLKANEGSVDGWKDQWGIPILWATKHVNHSFNYPNPGGGQGLIPKDHNKMIDALTRFHKGLEDVTRYQNNPMPLIYKQTVIFAVWSWMVLGVVAAQDPIRRPWYLAILTNIPFYTIIKYCLILGWLRVAEFIVNPFETDGKDRRTSSDICLEDVLDTEIWRASVALKNTNQSVFQTG